MPLKTEKDLEIYNIVRFLFESDFNKKKCAGILNTSVYYLNKKLYNYQDEAKLLYFLFSKNIQSADKLIKKEKLFNKGMSALKIYKAYKEKINRFKKETRSIHTDPFLKYKQIFKDDLNLKWHTFTGFDFDKEEHKSLFSVIKTLHSCFYKKNKAARKLGITLYKLNRSIAEKKKEAVLLYFLFNSSKQAALKKINAEKEFENIDALEIYRKNQEKIKDYRHKLKNPGIKKDPYKLYQVILKHHTPGLTGFNEAILKKLKKVWDYQNKREFPNKPVLFSFPDILLHKKILKKIRKSSFKSWNAALNAFAEKYNIPVDFEEINLKEETRQRALKSRQIMETLPKKETTPFPSDLKRRKSEFIHKETMSGTNSIYGADDMGWYTSRLKHLPKFSKEEEKELIKKAQKGDKKSMQLLVDSELKTVVQLAKKYYFRSSSLKNIEIMDLVSEGNLGLIEAVKHFDLKQDVKFSTYSRYWIIKYILNAVAASMGISSAQLSKLGAIKKIIGGYLQKEGRYPEISEIAAKIKMKPSTVKNLISSGLPEASLDSSYYGSKNEFEHTAPPLSQTVSDEETFTDKLLLESELTGALDKLFKIKLSCREEFIVRARLGFGSGFTRMSYETIAQVFGTTVQNIQIIEKKAFKKMKRSPYFLKLAAAFPG